MKTKWNLIVKVNPDRPWAVDLRTAAGTRLSADRFEGLKALNPFLQSYRFIPAAEVDCTWWHRVEMMLTERRLYKGAAFEVDWYGNVSCH